MASKIDLVHVLLVTFPTQGHVNPLLTFAKLLASTGNLLVTLCACKSIGEKLKKVGTPVSGDPIPVGDHGGMIRFEFFDDGCAEDNDDERNDFVTYLPKLEFYGKIALKEIINHHAKNGLPAVTCLINNPLLPWVCDVGEELDIPCAMLWVQSCSCFSSYYHFENSLVPFPSETEPNIDVTLPSMPVLKSDEIPSILHPSTTSPFMKDVILRQFKNLSKTFCVLMDSFQELENDPINYMSQICPIRAVGPLFKNPLLKSTSKISGDLIKADDCLGWLDTKDTSSVVYISFGSIVSLNQEQVTEMSYGLLNAGVSFLWVMKKLGDSFNNGVLKPGIVSDRLLELFGDRGMIVHWSPQDKVLSHPAVSCFVTHCGWSSTMEALSSGVPVITFPQWGDQVTNAKYLIDEWKVGIRMSRGVAENRVIGRDEMEECFRKATSGVTAAEMKKNALKWKKAAEEAVAEGGTSDRNLQEFVNEVRKKCDEMVNGY